MAVYGGRHVSQEFNNIVRRFYGEKELGCGKFSTQVFMVGIYEHSIVGTAWLYYFLECVVDICDS